VAPYFAVSIVAMRGQIGSGSLPVERLPSAGLALTPIGASRRGLGTALDILSRVLRSLPVPMIGRIAEQRLLLDLRCLDAADAVLTQVPALAAALHAGFAGSTHAP
jgi:L-seryl-tRNA(Ser) seleniumtransferase